MLFFSPQNHQCLNLASSQHVVVPGKSLETTATMSDPLDLTHFGKWLTDQQGQLVKAYGPNRDRPKKV